MAVFNFKKRQIECRIVYYGPGRSGKTTNLECIYRTLGKYVMGEMVSVNTLGDRTLFFDFLPMGLGKIRGCDVRVQLLTVPGQVQYSSTRRLVLKGADGVVFVADALRVRREKNMASLQDLKANLETYRKQLGNVPLVMQFNKMDLCGNGIPVMSREEMEADLNSGLKAPVFEASALTGKGVGVTLKKSLELTLRSLQRELGWAR